MKHFEKKLDGKLHKNAVYYFEQILQVTPNKIAPAQLLTSYLTNHPRLVVGCFYGISTLVGYLMANPVYIYIYIYTHHL